MGVSVPPPTTGRRGHTKIPIEKHRGVAVSSVNQPLFLSAITKMFFKHSFFLIVCWSVVKATGALMPPSSSSTSSTSTSRRAWLGGTVAAVLSTTTTISSPPAWAAADCFQDCQKNCRQIAPKDPAYCLENCRAYCDQPDRTGKYLSLVVLAVCPCMGI